MSDIGADAVKTGMIANSEMIRVVAAKIREHGISTLVVDPVMVTTSGDRLLPEEAVEALRTELLPLATVVTPNLPEAGVLIGREVTRAEEMRDAAKAIVDLGVRSVLVKGGHATTDAGGDAIDVLAGRGAKCVDVPPRARFRIGHAQVHLIEGQRLDCHSRTSTPNSQTPIPKQLRWELGNWELGIDRFLPKPFSRTSAYRGNRSSLGGPPDGTGVRDYLHVADLARGHLAALNALRKRSGAMTVNLGTGRGYSVLEMIRAFSAASRRPVPYRVVGRRPGDVAQCYADPSLAFTLLGWKAQLGIEAMCADTWRWQQWAAEHLKGRDG